MLTRQCLPSWHPAKKSFSEDSICRPVSPSPGVNVEYHLFGHLVKYVSADSHIVVPVLPLHNPKNLPASVAGPESTGPRAV